MINIARYSETNFEETVKRIVTTSSLFDPTIEARAREIIEAVAIKGDGALLEFTERFDGAKISIDQLRVRQKEINSARQSLSEDVSSALSHAHRNISLFSKRSLRKDWQARNSEGALVGEKFDPFDRVGIYIPGGSAPLVSTALMTITLAKTAGCREIVICTPCNRAGKINPALLAAANHSGATEIYRVGGAQAVAAMALGTSTIHPVQKIFGPGNAYVVAAKRILFGRVAVDLLPGPSEVLILADEAANAGYIAADLLAQAEQGSGRERVWLVTTSKRLIDQVAAQIETQLPKLSRKKHIASVLQNNGWLILVRDTAAAIGLVNEIAPEHCELICRNARALTKRIITAGAISIGAATPTVVGDYIAGPSHELPTGGSGRSFSGLTTDQFQRRTSIVEYSGKALAKAAHPIKTLAGLEGLDAHARSIEVRFDRNLDNRS